MSETSHHEIVTQLRPRETDAADKSESMTPMHEMIDNLSPIDRANLVTHDLDNLMTKLQLLIFASKGDMARKQKLLGLIANNRIQIEASLIADQYKSHLLSHDTDRAAVAADLGMDSSQFMEEMMSEASSIIEQYLLSDPRNEVAALNKMGATDADRGRILATTTKLYIEHVDEFAREYKQSDLTIGTESRLKIDHQFWKGFVDVLTTSMHYLADGDPKQFKALEGLSVALGPMVDNTIQVQDFKESPAKPLEILQVPLGSFIDNTFLNPHEPGKLKIITDKGTFQGLESYAVPLGDTNLNGAEAIILMNLVGNAIKFSVEDTPITIDVRNGGIEVVNFSKTRPSEDVFSPGSFGEGGNRGMGLAIAKWFAEESGRELHMKVKEIPKEQENEVEITVE